MKHHSGGRMKNRNEGRVKHHAPTHEEAQALIDNAVKSVGEAFALGVLGVHRTTLMRWRTGAVRIPHAALALLRVWDEGLLPGMGDDWRGFRVFGDKLYTAAGVGYSAREIDGWHWKEQFAESVDRRNTELEAKVRDLAEKLDKAHGAAANDGHVHPTSPPPLPKRYG
jgi:DNA-binding transcriptional regulator YiaG